MGASKPWPKPAAPAASTSLVSEAEPRDAVDLAAPDVLVVDSSDTARDRLRLMLELAGYAVTTARNGSEALDCLRRRFIPLLVTDVAMAGMGGLTLCRTLSASALPSYLYKIVLSYSDAPEEFVNGLAAGADAYLSKRVTASELLATLAVGRRLVGRDQALRRAVMKNRVLADTDDLTGSGNRRRLMRGLEHDLSSSAQRGRWLSVLMCDLDRFKSINDQYGHAVGDEILQSFVARTQAIVAAAGGWMSRYGGEEFVVVLPGTALGCARNLARHIRVALAAEPVSCSAGALAVTVSIGVIGVGPAQWRAPMRVGELLERADACMYESKAHGRDTVTARRWTRPGARGGNREAGHPLT